MKRFVRILSLVLVLSMCLAVPVAAASELPMPRASNYFGSVNGYLHRTSSSQVQVWFDVSAVRGMTQLGAYKIKVQRSSDLVNWTTIQTFYMSSYPNMVGYNTGNYSSYVTCNAASGYYYRAVIEFYAKDSGGTGYYTYNTPYI